MQPVVVEGILKPDGTLELNEKLALPPGKVEVVVRPIPDRSSGSFIERIKARWAEMEAQGYAQRSYEEIEAERKSIREELDEQPEQARTIPQPPVEGTILDRIRAIREGQKARGFVPRSAEEIDAERERFREEWNERSEQIERMQEEARKERNKPTS